MGQPPLGITPGWWLVWSLVGSLVWLAALVSVIRTKDHLWRAAAASRGQWLAALIVANIGQRFLPEGALAIPAVAVAACYFLLMKPRLTAAAIEQEDRRTSAFEAIARDMRRSQDPPGERPEPD